MALSIQEIKKKKTSNREGITKKNFTEKVKEFIHPNHVSTNMYELESASADLTSLPSYHYKFKKNYLATHVIRPGNVDELSKLIKICRGLEFPVTIRSAGTSCFSSATPTKGGILIDMRRLNKIFEIDADRMTVKCGTGISWLNLIEALTDHGLAPKCYPTSFKTSCVGGFIATPGTAGIGTPKNGSMKDSINSLVIVTPKGEVVDVTTKPDAPITLDDVVGTYGIYGAIATVELSVVPLKTSLEIIGYGFKLFEDAMKCYSAFKNDLSHAPFFLSISNQNFEKYSHIEYPEQDWLVWAVFYDDPQDTAKVKAEAEQVAAGLKGISVKSSYIHEKWRDINDAEVAIGRSANNLIFQEYWISDKTLPPFIEDYYRKSQKYKFRTAIYFMAGKSGFSRVKIFGLTDINRPREFFAIKAFFHERAVNAFKLGDRLYTIGVVNTFYLHKFQRREVAKMKFLKDKLDPKDLFNSMRYFNPTMKFWRVNLLFKTAKFLYKLF